MNIHVFELKPSLLLVWRMLFYQKTIKAKLSSVSMDKNKKNIVKFQSFRIMFFKNFLQVNPAPLFISILFPFAAM